jgi:hypothetical protein
MLEKVGELEGASMEEREMRAEGFVWDEEVFESQVTEKTETVKPMAEATKSEAKSPPIDEKLEQKIKADPRNALDL